MIENIYILALVNIMKDSKKTMFFSQIPSNHTFLEAEDQ